MQAVQRIYAARIHKIGLQTDRRQDVALAWEMYNDAMQLHTPSALQQATLNKAYEMGLHSHFGYECSLAALQVLGQSYPENKRDADEKMLDVYILASNTPKVKMAVVAALYVAKLNAMADERLAQSDFDGAIALLGKSLHAERLLSREQLYAQDEKIRGLKERGTIYRRIANLKTALEHSPEPDKATELVKLVLLDWDDPNIGGEAIPFVAPDLRRVASSMLLGIGKLTEAQAKELGDWYKKNYIFSLFRKSACLGSAKAAYDRALALHVQHDVIWLELKNDGEEAQALKDKIDHDAALKAQAQQRRDTLIITTHQGGAGARSQSGRGNTRGANAGGGGDSN